MCDGPQTWFFRGITQRRYRMITLRYYCRGQGNAEITRILAEIGTRHNIPREVLDLSSNGVYDQGKEKRVYEAEFKPRAKILKRRTGRPMAKELRSRGARNYFVSTPGTMALVRDGKVESYTVGDGEIIEFLKMVLIKGHALLEERSQ
jgi:hypothetical protein